MIYILLIAFIILILGNLASGIGLIKIDKELSLTDEYNEHIEKLYIKRRRLLTIVLLVIPISNSILTLLSIIYIILKC